MDIERLKELRKSLNAENWNAKTKIEVIALTDDLIARQSATSDEVSEAIEELMSGIWQSSKDGYSITLGGKTLDLAITALQAYQPWISVGERLPEIPEGRYGVMCNVMVDNCSSTKVMSLLYEKDTVRGKTVCRWKWYGKISPWNVTHWKPLPEPPKGERA
jgi:hypothetical protein